MVVKYGDIGNKKLFERYEVDTMDGPVMTSRLDEMYKQDNEFIAVGAGKECPRCGQKRAVFFGDEDGEHWCLPCQILADPEALR